jgi:hypothetical protein
MRAGPPGAEYYEAARAALVQAGVLVIDERATVT